MSYVLIITADFEQDIDDQAYYFKANTTYPLIDSYVEVLVDGLIVTYHQATVQEQTVNIPEEYSTIIDENDVPKYATEMEKWEAERTDATTDYITAYSERLGIDVSIDADVDSDYYRESEDYTREDPEA